MEKMNPVVSQFTPNALILIKYFPSLIIPVSDRTLNLFDIIVLASTDSSITNIPLLPYQSIGSLYSKEIKKIVGDTYSREITKLFYNILNCLANYYQGFSSMEILKLLKSVWSNILISLQNNINIETLYISLYTNPILNTIPWIEVFNQCKTFELNRDNMLKLIDKLALDFDNLEYTLEVLPVNEYMELWKDKLNENQVRNLIDTYYKASGNIESLDNIVKVPFFINILDRPGYNSDPKFSAIAATEIYSNSLEGGLSPEQILTSPFMYLTHASHLEYLEQILSSNNLKPTPLREDQFPGVYLYPNIQSKENAYTNTRLDVIFIISLSLFKSRGWHISQVENYGNITSLTWSCNTLPKYLTSHYVTSTSFGELVTHYPIPLDYVEEIIAQDNAIDDVRRIVGNRFPVYTLTEFKQLPLIKRVKSLYLKSTYSDQPPNFCYSNLGGYDPIVLPIENIKDTLLNCGYDRNTVDNLINTKTYKELIELIKSSWVSNRSSEIVREPQIYPPYNI